MTPEHAEQLLPVIQAFAAGKKIQRQFKALSVNGLWIDDSNPSWSEDYKWRIKPEKQTRWVNVYPRDNSVLLCATKEEADGHARGGNRIACIKIEFEDGEGL